MPAARSAIPFFKEGSAFFDTLNRKTVRRALGLTAALFLAALLTGCGGPGSIYANYQNVEDLLPVQVLGLDGAADAPELSCLAVSTEEGGSPLGLAASGSGVESALQALRESSPGKVLYFSHVQYILAGEALAAEGLLPLLDYMERMPTIRMHTPLVVVQGDTAAAAVLPGEGGTDTAALLDALSQELALRGDSRMYTCREIARALAERGAALCCAVTAETAADFRPGAEGVQLIPAGYGVLKGGALAGYLTGDAALGASLTALYHTGKLDLSDLLKKLTFHPACILRIPKGRLSLGGEADFTIFDLNQEWTVDPERFASKGRNTPFAGKRLKGKVKYTIVGGKIVYQDEGGR